MFIEVKDAMGQEALIDTLAVQAIEQIPEEKIIVVYFTNKFSMELTESYEDLKRKLKDSEKYF